TSPRGWGPRRGHRGAARPGGRWLVIPRTRRGRAAGRGSGSSKSRGDSRFERGRVVTTLFVLRRPPLVTGGDRNTNRGPLLCYFGAGMRRAERRLRPSRGSYLSICSSSPFCQLRIGNLLSGSSLLGSLHFPGNSSFNFGPNCSSLLA